MDHTLSEPWSLSVMQKHDLSVTLPLAEQVTKSLRYGPHTHPWILTSQGEQLLLLTSNMLNSWYFFDSFATELAIIINRRTQVSGRGAISLLQQAFCVQVLRGCLFLKLRMFSKQNTFTGIHTTECMLSYVMTFPTYTVVTRQQTTVFPVTVNSSTSVSWAIRYMQTHCS